MERAEGGFEVDREALAARLGRSRFRSRFRLDEKECAKVAALGENALRAQACAILRKNIGGTLPPRDGRQTPMRGFCVFIAQHATACCCRSCLRKFYGIPENRELSDAEIGTLADIVVEWILAHCGDLSRFPRTPDLF
ncbi:MAG: DUF4186 domain-containing protein [Victivallaceae bacterium]|nr:DUF4186 domain-containing protein [Victivallaceae bacterium]